MFELMLCLQLAVFGLLCCVYFSRRFLSMMSPFVFVFVIHLFLFFILPQLSALYLAIISGFSGSEVSFYRAGNDQVIAAQGILLLFTLTFFVARYSFDLFLEAPLLPGAPALSLTRDRVALAVLYILGLAGVTSLLLLAATASGVQQRSVAVGNLTGQFLFAGSLLCHFYVVLVAFDLIAHKRKLIFGVALATISFGLFLYLGGRGRAILLLVYLAWLVYMYRVKVTTLRMIVILTLIVAGFPFLFVAKIISAAFRTGADFSVELVWEGLPKSIVEGNVVSSFRSLAQVIGQTLPHGETPGRWFSETYYPEAWVRGVGLHLGMPGEAYLFMGAPGVLFLALFLGLLTGALDRVYLKSSVAAERLFFILLATWLCAIGWNLVDSVMKIIAVLAGPLLWLSMSFAANTFTLASRRREARRLGTRIYKNG